MGAILSSVKRRLSERRWDHESVVFDSYSGETHHLGIAASVIFRCVAAAGSIELAALCATLAQANSMKAPPLSPEEIGNIAARLRDIGLIWIDEDGN